MYDVYLTNELNKTATTRKIARKPTYQGITVKLLIKNERLQKSETNIIRSKLSKAKDAINSLT